MGTRVSEYARERELLKYDPTLLDNITYNDQAHPLPSSLLRRSPDPILTSLAQLGVWRTRTSRSLVSIFDRKWQYVVAEATPTLTLTPDVAEAESHGESLWLCQTAIPRVHGFCEWALTRDESSASSHLPVTIIRDLQADTRFDTKPYCLPGSPARFYAAAPIRSSRGVNIGVYCVLHDEPIPEEMVPDADLEAVIRDVARTVMRHLESRRATISLKRSDAMMNGITSFLDKHDNLHDGSRRVHSTPNLDARGIPSALDCNETAGATEKSLLGALPSGDNGFLQAPCLRPSASSPTLTALGDGAHGGKTSAGNKGDDNGAAAAIARPSQYLRNPTAAPDSSPSSWSVGHDSASIGEICMRTAGVVRASLDADCVVYVDASSGAFGSLVGVPGNPDQSSDPVTTSSGDELSSASHSPLDEPCQVLGISEATPSDTGAANTAYVAPEILKGLLSSLVKRYPRGKIFKFDEHGALQSSDSSEDGFHPGSPEDLPSVRRRYSRRRLTRSRVAELLATAFPRARSIAFAPVWDDKKQRWFAGSLACTHSNSRVFTRTGDLSYLRAFGMLTMAEVHRFITQTSWRAQSDVLNSLSHELRSPLHGLVLSAELLADTRLDTFQGNVLHTMEMCGRTLIDTVDHLLEYSKINNFVTSASKGKNRARGLRGRSGSVEDGMQAQLSDIRLDQLVEEVVESVFAGFQRSSTGLSKYGVPMTAADPDSEASAAMEPRTALNGDNGTRIHAQAAKISPGVFMYLDIEPSDTYVCHASAGAVRRIVMNLLGNSLKFTESGWVKVSLSREASPSKVRGVTQRMIKIVVADTGKGMSKDFLTHDVYKPFAQEDLLSAGTGLGLSLVKKLVSTLRGKISIKSELGVGTVTTVTLPMQAIASETTSKEQEEFEKQKQMLKGLRVHLIGFPQANSGLGCDSGEAQAEVALSATAKVCKDWLGMEIVPALSEEGAAPDIVLLTEAALTENQRLYEAAAWPPVVVVCPNAPTAHSRTMDCVLNTDGIFEFISQPTGPRKLAKVLVYAFNRWLDTQSAAVFSTSPRSPGALGLLADPLATSSSNRSFGGLRPSASGSINKQPTSYFPPVRTPPVESAPSPEPEPRPPSKAPALTPKFLPPRPFSLSMPPSPKPEARPAFEFLLVDDNSINLGILCAYMKKLGRTFLTATDGVEAVEVFKAQARPFACVLMDISMPRLDGLGATQQIRAHERDAGAARACPVFALTGLASADMQKEAFESGIDLFLTKPVKLKELSEILRSWELLS